MVAEWLPIASRGSHRGRAIDLLFLLPTLVILAAFLVYPLVYGIVLSLHDTRASSSRTSSGSITTHVRSSATRSSTGAC